MSLLRVEGHSGKVWDVQMLQWEEEIPPNWEKAHYKKWTDLWGCSFKYNSKRQSTMQIPLKMGFVLYQCVPDCPQTGELKIPQVPLQTCEFFIDFNIGWGYHCECIFQYGGKPKVHVGGTCALWSNWIMWGQNPGYLYNVMSLKLRVLICLLDWILMPQSKGDYLGKNALDFSGHDSHTMTMIQVKVVMIKGPLKPTGQVGHH